MLLKSKGIRSLVFIALVLLALFLIVSGFGMAFLMSFLIGFIAIPTGGFGTFILAGSLGGVGMASDSSPTVFVAAGIYSGFIVGNIAFISLIIFSIYKIIKLIKRIRAPK